MSEGYIFNANNIMNIRIIKYEYNDFISNNISYDIDRTMEKYANKNCINLSPSDSDKIDKIIFQMREIAFENDKLVDVNVDVNVDVD